MNRKKLLILVGMAVGIVLLMGIILIAILTKKEFPMNPPGTVGNTAGNLYNSGLYVERNGVVYFSNSYDGGALYSMTPDESDIKKVSNMVACNLVASDNFVYFFQNGTSGAGGFENVAIKRGLNSYNIEKNSFENITKDTTVYVQLVDNYLYLLSTDKQKQRFYKLKVDKSEEIDLGSSPINPACARNSVIYYAGVDVDHALHTLDTSTDIPRILMQGSIWYPVISGEWIYYLDLDQNYKLCRYSMMTQEKVTLTQDRVDAYNIYGEYIYYQKNSKKDPGLICMKADGSESIRVADGNYTDINVTSRYVYFKEFGNDVSTYHCRIGSTGYTTFDGAANSVNGNR